MPVGPIANSGKHSVEAALEPAQTDYYYFLAAPSGEVYYAKTLEEHNALKQKYITKNSEMGRDSEKSHIPLFGKIYRVKTGRRIVFNIKTRTS